MVMDLICMGDNVADYYPQLNQMYPGGSAYNVAVLAARYGLRTAYLGPMGDDPAGRYLLQVLWQEGVDIAGVEVRRGPNARSEIRLEDGERQILRVDKGIYRPGWLDTDNPAYLNRFPLLHTTTYGYTEEYLQQFHSLQLTVSFDYSFRSDREYIKKTAPWVELAFFSSKGLKMQWDTPGDCHYFEDFMREVSSLGPSHVLVTLGEQGSLLYQQGSLYYQPAEPVEIVDTLGAGDAFIAAYLSCYRQNTPPREALKQAGRAAAHTCTYFGGCGHGINIDDLHRSEGEQ